MIRLRENSASAILSLCPALSNKSRCGRRFDGAPFLCFGGIDFHGSERTSDSSHGFVGVRHTPALLSKLEKEQGFLPFKLREERRRYFGNLFVGENAITFFFYLFC